MGSISFNVSYWFLPIIALIAIGLSILVYWKRKSFSEQPKWQILFLAALRALGIFFLLLLLLNPILRKISEHVNRPALVFAQDNSQSISTMNKTALDAYIAKRNDLRTQLSQKFDLNALEVDVQTRASIQDSFSGHYTDLNSLFDYCSEKLDLRYIKGIILASDGIYNQGKNPIYHSLLKQIPVYTIALGDSTQTKDLAIYNLYHSEMVHANDHFYVQVDIKSYHTLLSECKLKLQEYKNQQWIDLETITFNINQNNYFSTFDFNLVAGAPGTYRYRVICPTVDGEKNKNNNQREFFVNVQESKVQILLLANAPHPDLAAIRNAVLTNAKYTIDIKFANEIPATLAGHKVLILHHLPSFQVNVARLKSLLAGSKIPIVYILGESTDVAGFQQMQDQLQIQGNNRSISEALPIINNEFSSFSLPEKLNLFLQKVAPLNTPFGTYITHPAVYTILSQRIGKVETTYPLWAISDQSGNRNAYISGDGLWKWRLNEFSLSGNTTIFDELLLNTIQFVSTKLDDRRLRVYPAKQVFGPGENILFTAEFYNDNNTRVNDPDVHLALTDEQNNEYPYTFSKTEDFYTLNAGTLQSGTYRFKASTQWNKQQFLTDGRLSISSFNIEMENTVADHSLLRSLCLYSGGKMFYPDQLEQLQEELMNNQLFKPTIHSNTIFQPMIDLRWMLFFIALLFATEWFFRRYWGAY